MRRSNFALRLQPSLLEELRRAAEAEGVALNQLINVAVAEKISALRTEEYFQQRAARANRAETLRILSKAGRGNAPIDEDKLADGSVEQSLAEPQRKKQAQGTRAKRAKRKLRNR